MSDVNWPSPDRIAEMVLSALGWHLNEDEYTPRIYQLRDSNWRVINHWEADSELEALRFALEHAKIYLVENEMYDEPK